MSPLILVLFSPITVIHQSESYNDQVMNRCLQLWTTVLRDTSSLTMIFSNRVIYLLSQATDSKVRTVFTLNNLMGETNLKS